MPDEKLDPDQNSTQDNPPQSPNPSIDNDSKSSGMEVHKHPHHVTHKKKWNEYVLEFLMLFLAVFLGFLAENFREHQVEKERAKQYLESFYEDLKADTARISIYINFDEEKMQALENLSNCYDSFTKDFRNTDCMLEIIKHSAINRPFIRTDRTLQQLANAGGFRLLKEEDADSISSYDEVYNNFKDFQTTIYQDAQNNVRNTLNSIGNFKANVQMFRPKRGERISVISFKKEDVTEPILFSTDKTELNKYFNGLQLYYRVTYNHIKMMMELKNKQMRLLEYFKSKYEF